MAEEPQPVLSFLDRYASRSRAWASAISLPATPIDEGRRRHARSLPWVDAAAVRPEPSQVALVLSDVLADLQASAASNRAVLDRMREAADSGAFSAAALLRAVLDQDGPAVDRLAEAVGVPTQVVHFVGVFLTRPFLQAVLREFDPQSVPVEGASSSCPACGQEPALALLMPEDGQRRLWCRYCGVNWPARRLRCLGCGISDASKLGYFVMEGETGRRVDYCEQCRRYIKTIDLRAMAREPDTVREDLEDLLTGDLDAAAVAEGFLPLAVDEESTEWRRSGIGSERNTGGRI